MVNTSDDNYNIDIKGLLSKGGLDNHMQASQILCQVHAEVVEAFDWGMSGDCFCMQDKRLWNHDGEFLGSWRNSGNAIAFMVTAIRNALAEYRLRKAKFESERLEVTDRIERNLDRLQSEFTSIPDGPVEREVTPF